MLKFKAGGENAFITSVTAPFVSVKRPDNDGDDSISSRQRSTPAPHVGRKSSFISSDNGFSKASVIFKNVSVPLAWPTDEYFGTRRECREFTIQLLFRTADGKEIFSRVRENVNRSVTDVNFDELFVFPFQSPDFSVEVIVYCKRTDDNASPSLVHSLSRSLGRSFGHSIKAYLKRAASNTISASSRHYSNRDEIMNVMLKHSSRSHINAIDAEYLENYRNPDSMRAVGSTKFRLRNASLSGKTHTYSLDSLIDRDDPEYDRLHHLPIYGNICAELLVQPASVGTPTAEGMLDVYLSENGAPLQRIFCRLQGAQLSGFTADEMMNSTSSSVVSQQNPCFVIPITRSSEIESTVLASTLRLRCSSETSAANPGSALFVCESRSAYLGWRNALALQIADCAVWGDFASAIRNPHGFALQLPDHEKKVPSLRDESMLDGTQRRTNRRSRAPLSSECFQTANTEKATEKAENIKHNNNTVVVSSSDASSINTITQRQDSPDWTISTMDNNELDKRTVPKNNSAIIEETSPVDNYIHDANEELDVCSSVNHNPAIIEETTKIVADEIPKDDSPVNDLCLLHLNINSDHVNKPLPKIIPVRLAKTVSDEQRKSPPIAKPRIISLNKSNSHLSHQLKENIRMKSIHSDSGTQNEKYLISLEINKSDDTQIDRNVYRNRPEPPVDYLIRPYEYETEAETQTRTFSKYTKNRRLTNRTAVTRSLSRSSKETWKRSTVDSLDNNSKSDKSMDSYNNGADLSTSRSSAQTTFSSSNSTYQTSRSPARTSSSSSSNNEMQIAQTTFTSSGSSITPSPPLDNYSRQPPLLPSSYASLEPRPALKTTASFASGNRPAFENIYYTTNSYSPQWLPSILKKCPSASFSSQPSYVKTSPLASPRYGIHSSPRSTDIGNGWNTITGSEPIHQRNVYDYYTPDHYAQRQYADHYRYLLSCAGRSTYYDPVVRSSNGAAGRSSTRL